MTKSRNEFEERLYIVAKESVSQQNKIQILQDELLSNKAKISGLETENERLQGRIKEVVTAKMKEFIELSKDYSEKLTAKDAIIEETKAKWLKSYTEIEQIACGLEAKKNNMQQQLEKMREIVKAQDDENQYLVEEVVLKKNLIS